MEGRSANTPPVSSPGPRPVRQFLRRALALALPRRLFVVNGPARCRVVCLTFDDGPDPDHTPRLLDVLRDLNIPATFFVIGERAARYPEIVRRIADQGHALGHHSYHHREPDGMTSRGLSDEVSRTRALLKSLVGSDVCLFRPPKGKLTVASLWRLWIGGQTVVLWNTDPKDYAMASADSLRAYFDNHPLCGGDIVLLHDTHARAAEILPELAAQTRARGLSFGRVPDWMD
jgi:peptidoglycan/xylan/chitin deacetylase (PgdA/CDA1 family)